MKDALEVIKSLIEFGKEVKRDNYNHVTEKGIIMPDYISGEKYDQWMNDIRIFADRKLLSHPLYSEIVSAYKRRNNSWGTEAYDKMMSYLTSIENDDELWKTVDAEESSEQPKRNKMLFISHSANDIEYVKMLVDLIEFIGLKSSDTLFCSSLSGYDIPSGKHIYNYLREQFDKELLVLMLLSENYYSSAACLNEMGATWVKALNHVAILTPEFDYYNVKGAINASEICFKLIDKARINEFKDTVVSFFELGNINVNRWEEKRDEFLRRVNEYYEQNKYIARDIDVYFQGIKPLPDEKYEIILRIENNTKRDLEIIRIASYLKDDKENCIELVVDYNELKGLKAYAEEKKRFTFIRGKEEMGELNVYSNITFRIVCNKV